MTWLADHWLDILGWGGSALLVFSLLQTRVLRFRILNLTACVILIVFNALIAVWPMMGMNLVLAAINLWFIVRLMSDRHDERAFEVLEVAPSDAYLGHVLSLHAEDVGRFQPGLSWDAQDPAQHAFLIVKGEETVGVVLLRVAASIAHVQLDYVTPRFRDFSPGEFVWRRSGLLKRLGVTRVVTPEGMVAPYYERVGFRAEGSVYALEVS